ncbi:hypothetical protein COHA_005086 [Chlorella ohadii]|uniref:5-formyltetrahydrofolate cyclo-ligase n=1 Tax=Chlorella ohadii TaxID=2649997 RepID=A0AAD5H202_9CHLO|nr:hypothetical protein COHA_005086 [Chlorella ohadii]
MLRFSIAARGFRQQLQRCAAAARCQPPLPVPPTTRCFAMSAAAQDGQSVDALKRRVREEVKAALRALSTEQMAAESEAIAARLLASRAFADAPHAVIYVHCAKLREVDTTAVLQAAMDGHKRLYVPRVLDSDANMHFLHLDGWAALEAVPPFGIREPRPTYDDGTPRQDVLLVDEPLELVVMPGLAFDRTGRRLGRGGGYYDKFIEAARAHATARGWEPPLLVALAFRAQMVGEVPVQPHDVGIDAIITADEVIACSPAGAAALGGSGSGGGGSGGGSGGAT